MLVRVVRRLALEEIHNRIEAFEKKFSMSFEELEELYLAKRATGMIANVYFEWADLVHAYRGYMESGEFDYTVEETRDLSLREMTLLTPKRLELLYSLASLQVESINHLAQRIHRNVKNVHQDLQTLKKLDFVAFKKKGKRNIVPETLVEEITLLIR